MLDELEDLVEEYYALKVAEERKDDEVLSYEDAIKELKKSGHLPPEYPEKVSLESANGVSFTGLMTLTRL